MYGFIPTGTTKRMLESPFDHEREMGQNMAVQYQNAMQQSQHENNLQASEQMRRHYDSQTARMGQEKKYGLLGNLLRGF